METVYRGYVIRVASPTGGKAGKGHNKTSSISVAPVKFVSGSFKTTTIRFNVRDSVSFSKAIQKARAWVDARVAEDEAAAATGFKPIIDAARNVFRIMSSADFCGCYDGDTTDEYPSGVDEFIERLTEEPNKAGVKLEVK